MIRFSFFTHDNNSNVFMYVAPFKSQGFKVLSKQHRNKNSTSFRRLFAKTDCRRDLHKNTDPASLSPRAGHFKVEGP